MTINKLSPNTLARIAGALYLIGGVAGVLGILYIPTLVVPGNAAATVNNIALHESLFRFSIVSALVNDVIYIFVALVLYKLFKFVDKNIAVLMVILNLIAVPIAMLNELNNFAVLHLLHGANSLTSIAPDQWHALVPLLLNLHADGIQIASIFWGLWLFPMGYLVYKSGFLQKIIGVLLMIACFGYVAESFATFIIPDHKINIALLTSWVELILPLWFLIKGVNVQKWEQRKVESVSA